MHSEHRCADAMFRRRGLELAHWRELHLKESESER